MLNRVLRPPAPDGEKSHGPGGDLIRASGRRFAESRRMSEGPGGNARASRAWKGERLGAGIFSGAGRDAQIHVRIWAVLFFDP